MDSDICFRPTPEKILRLERGDCVKSTVYQKSPDGYDCIYPGDLLVVKDVYKFHIVVAKPGGPRFHLGVDDFVLLDEHRNKPQVNQFINESQLMPMTHGNKTNFKEENTMSMANELNKMFGAIQPGMCRLAMSGGVAVKTSSGYKSYNMKTGRLVNCDNFALDPGSEWFFCIPTNHVKTGDIILINGKPCCVKAATKDLLTVINYENNTVENVLPERHMFMGNMYFYSKVVSPFNTSGKKGGGIKKLMKYAMMSEMLKGGFGSAFGGGTSNGNNAGGMNPMMAMMMFGGGGMGDLFEGMFDDDEEGFGMMSDFFDDGEDDEEDPPEQPTPKKTGKKGSRTTNKGADDKEEA